MIRLELPEPPSLANKRWHWAERNRRKNAYQHDAYYMALDQQKPPKPPPEKVRIRAHLRLWNLRDEDNLDASLKWPLDALEGAYYVDDSPRHLEIVEVTQEIDRKNRGLTLEIEVVEP
ncbi:MAG: hypothetical protein ACODAA_00930 [Gemmatimonadota bacterium]